MNKTQILTYIFQEHLSTEEDCHGFEIQRPYVELYIVLDGYKYYEKCIPLETFHRNMSTYFMED